MFTWICPECHREVAPSYSECPTCAERKRGAAGPPPQQPAYPPQQALPQQPVYQQPGYAPQAPPPAYPAQPVPQQSYAPPQARPTQAYAAPPPPPPQYAQQPVYAPPPPPPAAYAQPPAYAPPAAPQPQPQPQYAPPPVPGLLPAQHERSGPSPIIVVLLVAAILVGGGYLLYTFVLSGNRGASVSAGKGAEAKQGDAAAQGHPYAKYLEVVGVRLTESGNKPVLKILVVNHSAADMMGLELKGQLGLVNGKEGDPPVATFTAKVGAIGPFESKDITTVVDTKMRAYELPDWQFLKVKYDITSPR
jgi:hypothetical protein